MEKSEMKHAYLIMAHHEFEFREIGFRLLCKRNDIFILSTQNSKSYPVLKAHNANLYILEKRIDIHWGHISQIKAEYALFETAFTQDRYAYYHLLSGVHLPLKSQDNIHCFFDNLKDKEVLAHVPNSDLSNHP